ncbi:uncharacterized protein LOC133791486 [Humulus lupulus]|uniref:uncharacterized protein LOC133791486 n=1 Tax=Humulus lupulus TaxID=3486 RepID=UPI002B4123C5|nr:uncharacterized protein LOC133791486 [Humulus lupulus]
MASSSNKLNPLEIMQSMFIPTMATIDASIEKIEKKLDQNNEEEWNQVDQMTTSITVNKIFLASAYTEIWEHLMKCLYKTYRTVLTKRIVEKVIPSLEQKKTYKLFLHQIGEQWSLFDTYRRNLEIIFKPAEEMGRNPMVTLTAPLSLLEIAKIRFCQKETGKSVQTCIDFDTVEVVATTYMADTLEEANTVVVVVCEGQDGSCYFEKTYHLQIVMANTSAESCQTVGYTDYWVAEVSPSESSHKFPSSLES